MAVIQIPTNSETAKTIEPILQPLSGETLHPRSAIVDENARSDVRAEGFGDCRQQHAYFDVNSAHPWCRNFASNGFLVSVSAV